MSLWCFAVRTASADVALVDALTQMTDGRKLTAKLRSRLASHVSRVALSGRAAEAVEGSAEVEFRASHPDGTGSSEDRLRRMFGVERKAFYNWAHVDAMPLLGEEFALELQTARVLS